MVVAIGLQTLHNLVENWQKFSQAEHHRHGLQLPLRLGELLLELLEPHRGLGCELLSRTAIDAIEIHREINILRDIHRQGHSLDLARKGIRGSCRGLTRSRRLGGRSIHQPLETGGILRQVGQHQMRGGVEKIEIFPALEILAGLQQPLHLGVGCQNQTVRIGEIHRKTLLRVLRAIISSPIDARPFEARVARQRRVGEGDLRLHDEGHFVIPPTSRSPAGHSARRAAGRAAGHPPHRHATGHTTRRATHRHTPPRHTPPRHTTGWPPHRHSAGRATHRHPTRSPSRRRNVQRTPVSQRESFQIGHTHSRGPLHVTQSLVQLGLDRWESQD